MTALDSRGPDWRAWIMSNLDAGCAVDDMALRMVEAGWLEVVARDALATGAQELGRDAPPVPRPELPALGRHDVDGHDVIVTMRLAVPALAVCEDVLSPDECDALLAFAQARGLRPSTVVDEGDGRAVAHPERTSSSVMLSRAQTDLIAAIEARLAGLIRWPIDRGEGLQILRYGVGQEYRPHFDAFPDGPADELHGARGGQRVSTVLVYLQSPDSGGGTSFPHSGLSLRPRAGTAILFHNVDPLGRRAEASLHAGEPVEKGEKIVLTYWQRERAF